MAKRYELGGRDERHHAHYYSASHAESIKVANELTEKAQKAHEKAVRAEGTEAEKNLGEVPAVQQAGVLKERSE